MNASQRTEALIKAEAYEYERQRHQNGQPPIQTPPPKQKPEERHPVPDDTQ